MTEEEAIAAVREAFRPGVTGSSSGGGKRGR